jgi:hypothetical protein
MYTSTDPDLPLLKHEKEQLEAIYEVFPKERECACRDHRELVSSILT